MVPELLLTWIACAFASVFIPDDRSPPSQSAPPVLRPPMGWRTWNGLGEDVSQDIMEKQMHALVARRHLIDGVPTSLYDLGYHSVGLDDGWTDCVNGSFHDKDGKPMVNSKFPSLTSMNKVAHSLNISSGFYMNPCGCDEGTRPPHYQEDADAIAAWGFDGVKVDACGPSSNMTAWRLALKLASTRHMTVENCRNYEGVPEAEEGRCPFDMFRSTEDNSPDWLSLMNNLQTNARVPGSGGDPHGGLPVAHPGCWSYTDMLEVGAGACGQDLKPGTCGHASSTRRTGGLSLNESRAHFGAWAIVSSPLILGHDLTDEDVYDAAWPVVSNKAIIAVNQGWAGEVGRLVASSPTSIQEADVYHGRRCECVDKAVLPEWVVYAKALSEGTRVAVLAINIGNRTVSGEIALSVRDVLLPGASGGVAWSQVDAWEGSHLPSLAPLQPWRAPVLSPRSSAFVILEQVV